MATSGSDTGSRGSLGDLLSEADEMADMRSRYEQLKARKESRRLLLQEKLKRLKQVCVEEAVSSIQVVGVRRYNSVP